MVSFFNAALTLNIWPAFILTYILECILWPMDPELVLPNIPSSFSHLILFLYFFFHLVYCFSFSVLSAQLCTPRVWVLITQQQPNDLVFVRKPKCYEVQADSVCSNEHVVNITFICKVLTLNKEHGFMVSNSFSPLDILVLLGNFEIDTRANICNVRLCSYYIYEVVWCLKQINLYENALKPPHFLYIVWPLGKSVSP